MPEEQAVTREKLLSLVEGKLPWVEARQMIRMDPKDQDRFWKYLEVLQQRMPWKDKILLRISDHLYIIAKADGARVVKCDCGQEFGDYRVNWKLSSCVYVRKTREEMSEVYTIQESIPNVDLVELREFYCPGCFSLLGTELVPPGYPPVFEMLPDLDTFYREWLGMPLGDERADWSDDRTAEQTRLWVQGG